jgi:Flp pilus assembly protein CpaB
MIASVVGLGLVTTFLVTAEMDKHQRNMQGKIADLERQTNQPAKVVYVEKKESPDDHAQPDFQSQLRAGYRAVTIPVDTANGSTLFMTPGSHVDIMSIRGSGDRIEAAPILSDVEVVAVGSSFEKSAARTATSASSSVTVSVTPKDATKLLKGQVIGKLFLTLRSTSDRTPLAVSDFNKPEPKPTQIKLPLPPQMSAAAQPIKNIEPAVPTSVARQVELWEGNRKDIVSFQ